MHTREAQIGMLWKLRRIAAHYRQQDVSTHCGISMTRYRAIERGEAEPTDLDRRLIEKFLPPLPPLPTTDARSSERPSAESP
jgi:transcriptional regulator with XRE-family HTH domain